MRKIPLKIREHFDLDPYYKNCVLKFEHFGYCEGRIEIHHNLIYAGRQSDEEWTMLPLCSKHHAMEKRKDIKEVLNQIMIDRGTPEEVKKVSKVVNYEKYRNHRESN
jgi:hypothetical protein